MHSDTILGKKHLSREVFHLENSIRNKMLAYKTFYVYSQIAALQIYDTISVGHFIFFVLFCLNRYFTKFACYKSTET